MAFTPRQLALYRLTVRIVEKIPQAGPEQVRCHEVARIVGGLLDLQVQDGRYGSYQHSWCWTDPFTFMARFVLERSGTAILDPYAIGSFPQVRLLRVDAFLPHLFATYQPGEECSDIDTAFVAAVVDELKPMVDIWKRDP